MEKRLRDYLAYMESQVGKELDDGERSRLMEDLLVQIGFFQHERLIHLIVTFLFAILTFLFLLFGFVAPSPWLVLLVFVFLILLLPYIRHYYILENGVQKLYTYYDALWVDR